MNHLGRLLIKRLANALAKSTEDKAVLFTKEINDLLKKFMESKPLVKPRRLRSRELSTDSDRDVDTTRENEGPDQVERRGDEPTTIETDAQGSKDEEVGPNKNEQKDETGIDLRTKNILVSIESANGPASLLKRLEILNDHLKKHPEGIGYANQIGARELLLMSKDKLNDRAAEETLRETLSLVGHCDPPRSSGVRILSIDGGGMRGLVAIHLLKRLEELSGRRIHELFDYVCGVSTGAIITCCSMPPFILPLGQLRDLYLEMGRQIFKQNAFKGAGKLVLSCAYYETSVWERLLKQHVGTTRLLDTSRHRECPKISVLSTVRDRPRVVPFLFRNYSPPRQDASDYPGSCNHTVFEAMRASAAAPSVFEEFKSGGRSHLDGGIVANNPAGVAVHEVKALWPEEEIGCLVSCGTGTHPRQQEPSKSTSWKRILDKVLESATDTEAVHTILDDLLAEDVYHRFNPLLTAPFAIDEIAQDKVELLERDTQDYCERNHEKLSSVANRLTQPRSFFLRCKDRLHTRAKLAGYRPQNLS